MGYTYRDGGPMAAVWGWVAVSLTNILMAVALAELVSAYPVAGGSYVWCAPIECKISNFHFSFERMHSFLYIFQADG